MSLANEFAKKSLFEEEFMNMDLIYNAIDSYKNAISYSKERNIE